MDVLATALLALFTAGYLVLAGADIGVGMLLPWLGRDQDERRTVLAAIGPFFLGNEVWLVATAGVMAGAFPGLEHTLLYEHRGAFVLLLLGWVVRDAGLWWRGRVDAVAWRTGCDTMTVAGSWALALALGAVFGEVLAGTPLPAPVMAGLLALHGGGFAKWRLTGAPLGRAVGSYPLTAAVLVASTVLAGLRLDVGHAAAGPASVRIVALSVAVLLPFLLAAQALTWWTFRHRVTGPGYL
ncbi:cytochrome d ubiquinol oxidase subunit II [Streptomyces longispororuber]|uniref:cytochrome d ubiquinol oxidase subunit II n=1 Tax=Streptomyces longispororuber TaxID=68230 RepID=UPI0033FD1155